MNNPYAHASEQYRKIEVGTVNKFELLVMLFDGLARFLREGAAAIECRDIALKAEKLDRALAIICELRSSLNHQDGGEFATRMDALYAYMSERILDASMKLDPAICDEVIALVLPLREAWAVVARRPPAEAAPDGQNHRENNVAQADRIQVPEAPRAPQAFHAAAVSTGSAQHAMPVEVFG